MRKAVQFLQPPRVELREYYDTAVLRLARLMSLMEIDLSMRVLKLFR
jgi:hypothetical protein